MNDPISRLIAAEALPASYREVVERHWAPLAENIARHCERSDAIQSGSSAGPELLRNDEGSARRPLIVGINGAQGSGKSTLCRFLEVLLAERGLRAVTLSLDDLYLTKAERQQLGREVHPLFATRGVPGTHDVALGNGIIDALKAGRPTTLPRFDKAMDDRAPEGVVVEPPIDVILFEGWCVGTAPQAAAALREPVNRLERDEDPDGTWRGEVNRRLATDYGALFGRIDVLVMLKVQGFEAVRANRRLQEEKLARRNPGGAAIMDDAALERFLMHYERLTRWTLAEMPQRADIMIPIGADQRPE